MKQKLIILWLFSATFAYGQVSTVTLDDCYRLARENYPRLSDTRLQQEISNLKLKNIGTAWNPQLNLNGQATYQSEVTKVSVPIPNINIPSPAKDQYKVYLDVRQTIFDGGMTSAGSQVEKSALAADQQGLEVEFYGLHDRVNQLYFGLLLLSESENVLKLKSSVLDERIKVLESGYKNGTVASRDLDLLRAESLQTAQQIGEIYSERLANLGALGILTNQKLDEHTTLTEPVEAVKGELITRPELKYFDLLGSKLDQNSQLLQKSRNPKVFGFGQAGYGRPGLNMLKNTFDPYYLVGVGLSWNILDWKQTGRSREMLEVQKQMIGSQRAAFDQNLSVSLLRAGEGIKKAEQLLKLDEELVVLRDNIAKHSASQLENGTITSADYIVDLNALTQASINKKSHKIQLYQAVVSYNTLVGKP